MSETPYIQRVDRGSGDVVFEIHEGDVWEETGEPRSSLDVRVFANDYDGIQDAREPEVSWPSTSDKRPALARLLAEALVLAAYEADAIVRARSSGALAKIHAAEREEMLLRHARERYELESREG